MPSQSDAILELIAVVGELSAAALRRLHFKESYRYKLVTGLKQKKLIKLHSKDSIRGYRMTAGAKEMLLNQNPERFDFFLAPNADTNKRHSEATRRLRLHRNAEAIITLLHTGVIYPGGQTRALMLGVDMTMALTLLNSTGGYKRQFFRLDGSFERLYFAPNTPEGEMQVKMMCSSEIREALRQLLLSDLQPSQQGLRVEHDALRDNGTPVLLAYEFDLERLRRFRDSLQMFGGRSLVICFDFQQAVLEKYLAGWRNARR